MRECLIYPRKTTRMTDSILRVVASRRPVVYSCYRITPHSATNACGNNFTRKPCHVCGFRRSWLQTPHTVYGCASALVRFPHGERLPEDANQFSHKHPATASGHTGGLGFTGVANPNFVHGVDGYPRYDRLGFPISKPASLVVSCSLSSCNISPNPRTESRL